MKQDWKAVGSFGTLGLEIVLSILFGLFIGLRLDSWLGTEPIMAVIWFFLGVAAAGKAVRRTWKEMQAETAREEQEQGNPPPLYDLDTERARERRDDREPSEKRDEQ
jgi:F0F1-type ATP synthase assembly protein I